jgi:cathepsin L
LNKVKVPISPRAILKPPKVENRNIESLNFVELGYVNAVQRQLKCGSCYVFTAVGTLEGLIRCMKSWDEKKLKISSGQIFKKTKQLVKLSEQQLIDCARGPNYERNSGCKGGVVSLVFDYVKLNGVTKNSSYPRPYAANDTFPCSYNSSTSVTKLKDYVWPQNIDENYLKNLLAQIGPLSVKANSFQPFLSFRMLNFNFLVNKASSSVQRE